MGAAIGVLAFGDDGPATLRDCAVLAAFALAFGLLAAARMGRGAVRSARM